MWAMGGGSPRPCAERASKACLLARLGLLQRSKSRLGMAARAARCRRSRLDEPRVEWRRAGREPNGAVCVAVCVEGALRAARLDGPVRSASGDGDGVQGTGAAGRVAMYGGTHIMYVCICII